MRSLLKASTSSVPRIFVTVFVLLLARWILRGIYRLYFHPLSRYPGPKLSAFTRIPYLKAQFTGAAHTYHRQLHERYGTVVRVSPDELSFNDPQAWRDIYGHGSKGTRGSAPPKHWGRYNSTSLETADLVAAQGEAHAKVRRIFLPAFSDRALKQQEPLFTKYVDNLVAVLRNGVQENPRQDFDMVRLYNYTTFDIMGDLTFGEPLNMLAESKYDPWVSVIFDSVKVANRLSLLKFYPLAQKLFDLLADAKIQEFKRQHADYAAQRVTKRIQHGRATAGVDLWDLVLGQEDGKGLTRVEMDANASLFMIAGTETTATLLSGLTYLLLRNPEKLRNVVREVRGAFATSAEIGMEGIAALPYMNACIKEALRMYPPVPVGLPHLTPQEGSTICGEYIPAGITVTAPHHAMYFSEKHFKDATSFVPERWTGDERYANDQRAAVQPFSVGSRDCLGKNMAYHEMRLILAKVLYNFDLELCPQSERWMDQEVYTLWEKHPLMVRVRDARA